MARLTGSAALCRARRALCPRAHAPIKQLHTVTVDPCREPFDELRTPAPVSPPFPDRADYWRGRGILMGAWHPRSKAQPAHITRTGKVDGGDLSCLLGGRQKHGGETSHTHRRRVCAAKSLRARAWDVTKSGTTPLDTPMTKRRRQRPNARIPTASASARLPRSTTAAQLYAASLQVCRAHVQGSLPLFTLAPLSLLSACSARSAKVLKLQLRAPSSQPTSRNTRGRGSRSCPPAT